MEENLAINSEQDLVQARNLAKSFCKHAMLSIIPTTKFVTAVSELGRNMLRHAGGGNMLIYLDKSSSGKQGVSSVFSDQGPGIENLEEAMQDGYTTKKGMGMGLPGTKRIVAFFKVESLKPNGTQITISQW